MENRWKYIILLACLVPAIVLSQDSASANFAADLQDAVDAQQAGEVVNEDVEAQFIKEAPIGVLPSGTGDVATTGAKRYPLLLDEMSHVRGFGGCRLSEPALLKKDRTAYIFFELLITQQGIIIASIRHSLCFPSFHRSLCWRC